MSRYLLLSGIDEDGDAKFYIFDNEKHHAIEQFYGDRDSAVKRLRFLNYGRE